MSHTAVPAAGEPTNVAAARYRKMRPSATASAPRRRNRVGTRAGRGRPSPAVGTGDVGPVPARPPMVADGRTDASSGWSDGTAVRLRRFNRAPPHTEPGGCMALTQSQLVTAVAGRAAPSKAHPNRAPPPPHQGRPEGGGHPGKGPPR